VCCSVLQCVAACCNTERLQKSLATSHISRHRVARESGKRCDSVTITQNHLQYRTYHLQYRTYHLQYRTYHLQYRTYHLQYRTYHVQYHTYSAAISHILSAHTTCHITCRVLYHTPSAISHIVCLSSNKFRGSHVKHHVSYILFTYTDTYVYTNICIRECTHMCICAYISIYAHVYTYI